MTGFTDQNGNEVGMKQKKKFFSKQHKTKFAVRSENKSIFIPKEFDKIYIKQIYCTVQKHRC